MSFSRGRAAWLVTWWGVGTHAAVDPPVLAIWPVRKGPDTVRLFVERLYASCQFTAEEMLEALPPGGHNPYPARFGSITVYEGEKPLQVPWQGQVLCGHNPHLYARRVSRLRLGSGTYRDGSKRLEWEERPRPTGAYLPTVSATAPLRPSPD